MSKCRNATNVGGPLSWVPKSFFTFRQNWPTVANSVLERKEVIWRPQPYLSLFFNYWRRHVLRRRFFGYSRQIWREPRCREARSKETCRVELIKHTRRCALTFSPTYSLVSSAWQELKKIRCGPTTSGPPHQETVENGSSSLAGGNSGS